MAAWTTMIGRELVLALIWVWSTSSQVCPVAYPWDYAPWAQASSNQCNFHDPVAGPLFTAFRQRRFMMESVAAKIATGATLNGSLGLPSMASFPGYSGTEPWPVQFRASLEVLRISEINQKYQNYKIHFVLRIDWLDCRTMHNCTSIAIFDDSPEFPKFWRPRYRLTQVDKSAANHIVHTSLHLRPDGWIAWVIERSETLACRFDFGNMPFDEHECGFELTMPAITPAAGVWVPNAMRGEDLSNLEWRVDDVKDWKVVVTEAPTAITGRPSSQLKVRFRIERKPTYLVLTVVVPTLWIYLVSWIGLWIDPGAVPARAALGIIPVLIMINKQSSLDASLPPISGFTRLTTFLQISLLFVGLHMFEFGAVEFASKLNKQKKPDQESGDHTGELSISAQMSSRMIKHSFSWDAYLRPLSIILYAICCLVVFVA